MLEGGIVSGESSSVGSGAACSVSGLTVESELVGASEIFAAGSAGSAARGFVGVVMSQIYWKPKGGYEMYNDFRGEFYRQIFDLEKTNGQFINF